MEVLSPLIRRISLVLLAMSLMASVPGCSLFVMAGKLFFGDPMIESTFSVRTGVDLTRGEHELLVVCRTPHLIRGEVPTFEYELTSEIMRLLKQSGVKTVSTDSVSRWIDENGGDFESAGDLARDFDAEYIAIVDVVEVRFREENSTEMRRGHAHGSVSVFEVSRDGDDAQALQVFVGEFQTDYPRFNPVAAQSMSERTFQKKFIGHLGQNIARQFHDYRNGDDF